MKISHTATCAWSLLSCHCVPLRRIWIQLYTWVSFSCCLQASSHSPSSDKLLSLKHSVKTIRFLLATILIHYLQYSFTSHWSHTPSLHYLDQKISSMWKQSLCLFFFFFLKKPGNQQCSTTRQAFLKQMHITSHLGSKIHSSPSQKARALPSAEEDILFSWYFFHQAFKIHSFLSCSLCKLVFSLCFLGSSCQRE